MTMKESKEQLIHDYYHADSLHDMLAALNKLAELEIREDKEDEHIEFF